MKASHYWQFVKLKATGQCIRETISNAREFFLQQFSATDDLDAVPELTDLQIQKQLWQLRQNGDASDRNATPKSSQCRLRGMGCLPPCQCPRFCPAFTPPSAIG